MKKYKKNFNKNTKNNMTKQLTWCHRSSMFQLHDKSSVKLCCTYKCKTVFKTTNFWVYREVTLYTIWALSITIYVYDMYIEYLLHSTLNAWLQMLIRSSHRVFSGQPCRTQEYVLRVSGVH